MSRERNWCRILVLCALASALASSARSAQRSDVFDVDGFARDASDIVVVRQSSPEGATILEAWKGRLGKGEKLKIPALAPLVAKEVRKVTASGEGAVAEVTGERMVLFLKVDPAATMPATMPATAPATLPVGYVPVKVFSPTRISVAWVEKGAVYWIDYAGDADAATMVKSHLSDEAFRKQVGRIVDQTRLLGDVERIADLAKRAEALRPLTQDSSSAIAQPAWKGMVSCGKPALAVLRQMLLDDVPDQRTVVDTMVAIGGSTLAAELTDMVQTETKFWRMWGPDLKKGWWNDIQNGGNKRIMLQNRYGRLYAILYSLKKMDYPECRESVRNLRNFWKSQPQLDDSSGLDQIAKECDEVLAELGKPRPRP